MPTRVLSPIELLPALSPRFEAAEQRLRAAVVRALLDEAEALPADSRVRLALVEQAFEELGRPAR